VHSSRPRRSHPGGIPGQLTGPALRLLIGASVYREPAGLNALLFQIGRADTAADGPGAPHPDASGPPAAGPAEPGRPGQGPAPPFHAPPGLARLIAECEQAGLLAVHHALTGSGGTAADIPPVFVERQVASALHRDLAVALRSDEVICAHQHAAAYWQWRAAAWPQDRHADLGDLLEARYHLREAGDNDQAGALTEVVCAQLHAWGELDHEAALVQETLAWLPPRSPLRATWIHEIGKIAQTRGNFVEAERRYRQSLELFAKAGDAAAASRSQHRLGILAQARGDYAEAEHRYKESGDLTGAEQPAEAGDPGWPGGPPGAPGTSPGRAAPGAEPAGAEPAGAAPYGTAPAAGQPVVMLADGPRRDGMLCLLSSGLAMAAVLAGLFAAGIIRAVPSDGARGPATSSGTAAAVRRQAAAWLSRQISRSAIVSCDPAMCAALRADGLPAANLLALGPSAADPLGSDVVVATAAVRSLFGSRLAGVYAPAVVAAFGLGRASIQIRVVAPDGAVAYRNALRADLLARKIAGTQLLLNKEISVTRVAWRQLSAGQVDARLLTTIAALAAQHPLRIAGFTDAGPGAAPGTPLRCAEITAAGSAARASPDGGERAADARFIRSVLLFLRAQRPPYLAATLRTATVGGQQAVQVGFAGPSPLGLLTSGVASTDTSP